MLTWTTATEEICQDRPFISSLDLTGGDRHSVVVNGYRVKDSTVRVYDPAMDDHTYRSSDEFFGENPKYTRDRDTYDIHPR